MDKLAIFVEGQTEEVFVTELIHQIAGHQQVHIDRVCAWGGGKAGGRTFREVFATHRPEPNKQFYVIVYNSAGYSRVLPDIREHYENLCSQRFNLIIGIRDVKPQVNGDIAIIRSEFERLVPKRPQRPLLVLAVMEVEAWFIAETSHFSAIDSRLTPAAVTAELGYDPDNCDLEQRPDPAEDLHRVYTSVGRGYNKSRQHAERTVRVLNYGAVYLSLGARFSDLANLIAYLNGFFGPVQSV